MSSETTKFSTGARRSADANACRFDLIHPLAMLRLAETYAEGALKYGGENWERGMPVHDLLNHALKHIWLYLAGDDKEPHLPHAAWGLLAAIVSDLLWPELNEGHIRGPGCVLTPEIIARLEQFTKDKDASIAAGTWSDPGTQDSGDVARILRVRAEALEAAKDDALPTREQVIQRDIKAGDRCLVIKNEIDAQHPQGIGSLTQGDHIIAEGTFGGYVTYKVNGYGVNYIPASSLQLVESK